LILFLALLWAAAAGAQTTATITGFVSDPSGGLLTGARIRARSVETGASRFTSTLGNGRFTFPNMPPGTYEIRAEAQGFRPIIRQGVRVGVGDSAEVDFSLELGAIDQEVTVLAGALPVNTYSHELSYLVNEKSIRELPLNGRNYTDLALLQPGVIAYPQRDGGSVVAHGLGTSINGQDPRSNVYLLDGQPQNDLTNGPAGSAAGTVLGIETVQEFRVETNAYSAEFGRNAGGQFAVLSKSGTNGFHGSAYEFFRNDHLDARNFFDPADKPAFTRNQFGATAGGPIQKDKMFFFLGYEGLHERLGRTITSFVPDLNARQGILPDPANPGRTIQTGVDAAVRPYLNAMPLPTGPAAGDGLAPYSFRFNQTLPEHYFQARADRNLTANQQMFARYTLDDAAQHLPTDFPQFPRDFISRNQFATAEHLWTISPLAVNKLRASFSRTRIGQQVEANTDTPLPPFNPAATLIGDIDIGGMPRFGPQSTVNFRAVQNVFGGEESLALNRGAHAIKVGALVERYQANMFNPTFGLGIFSFRSVSDFLQNRPFRFIGLAPEAQMDRYWRFTMLAGYVQDAYRAARRLTLNFGLRYEYATVPAETQGRDTALPDLNERTLHPGTIYANPTARNISPRAGFAWDVFGAGRTALRGGYGLYFNTNNQQNLIVTVTNPPWTPRPVIPNPSFPRPNFSANAILSVRPIEFNLKNPNLHVWNLNFEHQLPGETVIAVGYAGTRGVHLLRNTDANLAIPQQLAGGAWFWPMGAPRRNPAFSTIELKKSDGTSRYNALLLEIRKRFRSGLTFQSAYTLSRNIDDTQASTFFSDSLNGNVSAMPEFPGFEYNKGLADYHATHNWVMNAIYELPFGRHSTGAVKALLEGWQLSAINNVRSGNPLTVFISANWSRSQWNPSNSPTAGFDRPSFAPGFTHQTAVIGSPDQYFNPAAFVLPPQGTLGNAGRGTLIGPNLRTLDVSLAKVLKLPFLGEQGRLQFRAEAFNVANHANFGSPSLIAFAGAAQNERPFSTFGRIRFTVTSSRQVQLALRVSF
jgi:hypothetical protein